jgi:hypothetical protein
MFQVPRHRGAQREAARARLVARAVGAFDDAGRRIHVGAEGRQLHPRGFEATQALHLPIGTRADDMRLAGCVLHPRSVLPRDPTNGSANPMSGFCVRLVRSRVRPGKPQKHGGVVVLPTLLCSSGKSSPCVMSRAQQHVMPEIR